MGPRRGDGLILGDARGQLPADHAVEQQVGGMAEDARDHDTDCGAGDAQRDHRDSCPPLRRKQFHQSNGRSVEVPCPRCRGSGRPPRRSVVAVIADRPLRRPATAIRRIPGRSGDSASSDSWVPAPSTRPSSTTITWSASTDGRDALRDNDHGRICGDLGQPGADQRIGVHIECGERVVEHVDRRAADHRSRDRQSLPLPAGEVDPALRDAHLQAVGVCAHELVGGRDPQRLPHLVFGRVRPCRSAGFRRRSRRTGSRVGAPARCRTTVRRCRGHARRHRRRGRRRRSRRTTGRSAPPASTFPNRCCR